MKASTKGSLAERIEHFIGNTGNLMFMNACLDYVNQPENIWDFYDWQKMKEEPNKYKELINKEYELVVYPLANILQENTKYIENVVQLLEGITIPIYCIGIGITLNENENLFIKRITEPVRKLISIVYKSGGKFACRGFITKEILDAIGKTEGLVIATGCPSMYQNGILNYVIDYRKVAGKIKARTNNIFKQIGK